jgi:hypothetical protein
MFFLSPPPYSKMSAKNLGFLVGEFQSRASEPEAGVPQESLVTPLASG